MSTDDDIEAAIDAELEQFYDQHLRRIYERGGRDDGYRDKILGALLDFYDEHLRTWRRKNTGCSLRQH
jgi:hypothetical protein